MMVMIDTNIIISAVLNPSGRAAEALVAAINAAVDYILTGDKDFLEAGIKFPCIVLVLRSS